MMFPGIDSPRLHTVVVMRLTADLTVVGAVLIASALLLPSSAVGQDTAGVATGSAWNNNWGRIDDDAPLSWSLSNLIDAPVEVGGWIAAGFTGNGHGNRTGKGNAPLPLNDVADVPVLNQFWVYAEKPLDVETECVDWGFSA